MAAFSTSLWESIPQAPPNPIFNLTARYKADSDPRKLNLGVGAYRDADGLPYVFKAVREAEALINDRQSKGEMNHEYLSITGDGDFVECAVHLAYGSDSAVVREKRVGACQAISVSLPFLNLSTICNSGMHDGFCCCSVYVYE